MTRGRRMGMAMLALALSASALHAQRWDDETGRFDLTFLVGEPQGEMGYLVDAGFGAQLGGAIPVTGSDGHLLIRGDFGFMIYGYERQQHCFNPPVGCRIGMDLTTSNSILFGGVGPELVLLKGPIQPYVNASMGFSAFLTTSSLGDDWGEDWATTTNYSDAMFAWRAGGGIRVRVNSGRRPVYLDFAVERHQNGLADYLTEGDIEDHTDGSITLYPNRTEANLVAFRMGVSFGITRGRRH